MTIYFQVRNGLRALLQRYGTPSVKKWLWDFEFSTGRWSCLDSTPTDCVYFFLDKYARKGHILDLGCGSGSTATELSSSAYEHYTGVDISEVAIQQALRRTRASHREDKHEFVQAELLTFTPRQHYDVILFRDSIYYIPPHRVAAVLNTYATFLRKGGVFLVRLWGSDKNLGIIATIESGFTILEKYTQDNPPAMVLVFH